MTKYSYTLVVEDIEKSVSDVEAIICAEKNKVTRYKNNIIVCVDKHKISTCIQYGGKDLSICRSWNFRRRITGAVFLYLALRIRRRTFG